MAWILWVAILSPSFAQTPSFQNFTIEDGLASDLVYSVYQDPKGFMWFGTNAGVSRFDGGRFENFGRSQGLGDNEIFQIAGDSQGRIWFLPFNGELSYYFEDTFHNRSNDSVLASYEPRGGYLSRMYEDSKGRLWFYGEAGHTLVIHPDGTTEWRSWTQFQPGSIVLIWEKDQRMFIAHSSGNVVGFDLEQDDWTSATIYGSRVERPERIPLNSVGLLPDQESAFRFTKGVIHELDRDFNYQAVDTIRGSVGESLSIGVDTTAGRTWVATSSGLIWMQMDAEGECESTLFLPGEVTSSALMDHEGNLWVTSLSRGVFLSIEPDIISYGIPGGGAKSPIHRLMIAPHDSSRIWWAGTNAMFGYFDKGNMKAYQGFEGLPQVRGIDIVDIPDQGVVVGMETGVIYLDYETEDLYSFPLSNKNIVWHPEKGLIIASRVLLTATPLSEYIQFVQETQPGSELFQQSTMAENMDMRFIDEYKLFVSQSRILKLALVGDDLIFATTTELAKLSLKTNMITVYDYPLDGRIIELEQHVNVRQDTILWMVANNGEIVGQRERGDIRIQLDTLYPEMNVKAFYLENDTSLWIGTQLGLVHLSFSDTERYNYFSHRLFSTHDGLPTNQVHDIVILDDTLYLATAVGLTVIPKSSLESGRISPPVFITKFETNGGALVPRGPLDPDQNNITIGYSGISFRSAQNLQYRYRLQENTPWVYTTSAEVSVFDLAPGEYDFEVQAKVPNAMWSQGIAKQSFVISAPYWRRPWFWSGVVTLSMGVVWLVLWVRMQRVREREELNLRASSAELKALRAQINPHFIFNALSSIQRFVLKNNREEANIYLTKFSRLIRMILNHSDKSEVTLEEELTAVRYYLDIERLRLSNRFDYSIECKNEELLNSVKLPPM
ncbi:MAG: histidine kinase, partial [Bacteroidota bacterium]